MGIALALATGAFFVSNAIPLIRTHSLLEEDVRSQVEYIMEHRGAGDVILINLHGSFGFSHYWEGGTIVFDTSDAVATRWATRVIGDGPMIFANQRSEQGIDAALRSAVDLASEEAGSGTIWLVRSHVVPEEQAAWDQVLGLPEIRADQINVGVEPLTVIHVR